MSKEIFTPDEIRIAVRERYSGYAETSAKGQAADCCSSGQSGCCSSDATVEQLDQVSKLYQDPDALTLPEEVTNLSLGCGDPVTLAALQPGQTVLDLGSGGGIDCFLAAKKVGESGQVIGVDMTPAMIERARENQQKVGAANVEFRLGEIEHLPVADATMDVILSNCVINLSPDKPQVFREAFRALRPGGKLAVSDIVTDGELPQAVKQSLSAWAGCVAGAWDVKDYIAAIQDAGFEEIEVQASYWDEATIVEAVEQLDPEVQAELQQAELAGKAGPAVKAEIDISKSVFSARITAVKPD